MQFLNLNCGTVNTTENRIKDNGIKTSLNSNKCIKHNFEYFVKL